MSAAQQFKSGVSERSGPKDWRGGLERNRARLGRVATLAGLSWYVLAIYNTPVKWEERLAECEGFQWDAGNSAKIWDRHQVMPTECEELFFNRPLIVGSDEQHSTGEERFYALGQTDGGRLLFAVFTIRGRLIRVISACDMSRKERRVFRSS
jgi:uncharacterized protein